MKKLPIILILLLLPKFIYADIISISSGTSDVVFISDQLVEPFFFANPMGVGISLHGSSSGGICNLTGIPDEITIRGKKGDNIVRTVWMKLDARYPITLYSRTDNLKNCNISESVKRLNPHEQTSINITCKLDEDQEGRVAFFGCEEQMVSTYLDVRLNWLLILILVISIFLMMLSAGWYFLVVKKKKEPQEKRYIKRDLNI